MTNEACGINAVICLLLLLELFHFVVLYATHFFFVLCFLIAVRKTEISC